MFPLPQELVSLIVLQLTLQQDLYNCTLINKAFHDAANPVLWWSPNLDTYDSTQRFIACIKATQHSFRAGQHIRHLRLNYSHWNDTHFILVMQHTPHLQRLCILPVNITDASLQQLPHHCPRLQSLKLYAQPTIDVLGQHCHQLTHLT